MKLYICEKQGGREGNLRDNLNVEDNEDLALMTTLKQTNRSWGKFSWSVNKLKLLTVRLDLPVIACAKGMGLSFSFKIRCNKYKNTAKSEGRIPKGASMVISVTKQNRRMKPVSNQLPFCTIFQW